MIQKMKKSPYFSTELIFMESCNSRACIFSFLLFVVVFLLCIPLSTVHAVCLTCIFFVYFLYVWLYVMKLSMTLLFM